MKKQKAKNQENPEVPESLDNFQEPSLTISLEEIALISEGMEKLPNDRQKSVVFDRLMMKLGKVKNYWEKVEKARETRRVQLANQLLEKKPND
jgi:hypothetical protein